MKSSISFILLAFHLILIASCSNPQQNQDTDIAIDVWYGDEQSFGHLGGHPQRWINILGNVSPKELVQSLTFSLNGGADQFLKFEEDFQRLARPGDFNVEMLRTDLKPGKNTVVIRGTGIDGSTTERSVVVEYMPESGNWPLPYSIDWSTVSNISEATQIVDGKWKLTPQGVRSVELHYDRVLAFGDESWRDYEVSTTVTFHDFTAPKTGRNNTNVTHAAIATRWPGHDPDGKQPTVKWHPLGATAEFRIGHDLQQCRWRIFDGQRQYRVESDRRRAIEQEKPYHMKHRVETLADGRSHYRVKLWPVGETEPEAWDFERFEPNDDVPNGSALLLAHHTDVTFGNVKVVPVESD